MSTIPADEAIEGARPEAGERPHGILIVDDEPAILESLELTLGADYEVHTAETGEAGLEVLRAHDVALIISDQVLPTMSGVEFLEHAIEIRPEAIRMMLTGYADIGSLARAINEATVAAICEFAPSRPMLPPVPIVQADERICTKLSRNRSAPLRSCTSPTRSATPKGGRLPRRSSRSEACSRIAVLTNRVCNPLDLSHFFPPP